MIDIKVYRLLGVLIFLTACDPSGGGTASVEGLSPDNTTKTCSSVVSSPIWKGERATATTVGVRGLWSDIKVIPGTTSPGTVYTDSGCACLKYTYWNGSAWQTEVISAGNTTSFTYIRLAYLSSGIPVVVWSNSTTTLQLAIRDSASLSAEGRWTVTNLLTNGASVRAVELKINAEDQVAILFARATAGSAHLVLCLADCEKGINYSSPSASLGTVGTMPKSFGLGWCNSGSGYFPAVAITGASNTSFAICRQGDLQNCLGGIANWSGGALQAFTGSGANRAGVQLAIDEVAVDAPVRAVLQNGSALAYYESSFAGGGCAAGTVGAVAAGGTISGTGANSASSYLELVGTADGNYHLVANEGTTSVRYYNTTTASFTSWHAAGTVALPTLAAAGTTRGGLAVDLSLGQAYTTFARTTAAAAFNGNLMFGLIEDASVASDDAGAAYYEMPMTLDGQVQLLTSQTPNISMAATAAGTPAVALVDYSAGSATAGVLKYGLRNGSASTSAWTVGTVPVVGQPQAVALAFDQNDKPWIAVYNRQSLRFYLVTNTETDGTGDWTSYTFPLSTPVAAATAPAYNAVALTLDKSANSVQPLMFAGVANHVTPAKTGVWAARLNPATGQWSNLSQLSSTNAANSISDLSVDSDSSGAVAVSYYDRGTDNRVEYVQSVNAGATWSTATAVTVLSGMGMGAKVRLNPVSGLPAISYFDKANNRLYYSRCGSALAGCASLGGWSSSFVENLTAGVSGIAAASEGLLGTGLSFTREGTAHIAYPVGAGASGALMLNQSGSDGVFAGANVLQTGKNASLTFNSTVSAVNFGQAGWNADSIRTNTGALHTAYVGPGNWLYVSSCGD